MRSLSLDSHRDFSVPWLIFDSHGKVGKQEKQ